MRKTVTIARLADGWPQVIPIQKVILELLKGRQNGQFMDIGSNRGQRCALGRFFDAGHFGRRKHNDHALRNRDYADAAATLALRSDPASLFGADVCPDVRDSFQGAAKEAARAQTNDAGPGQE